jgi:hypothetical protein
VSCDFDKHTSDGLDRAIIQDELFKINPHIDTTFRPSAKNYFVIKNIIKTRRVKFLRSNVLASLHNDKCYLGRCETCPDMCGIKL